MISKTATNFFLDATLLVVFLVLIWVSVVVEFVFPPGPAAEGWTLWGADYLAWRRFQFVVVATMALGVLVHVMLHWTWVCGVIASWAGRARGGAKIRLDDGTRTLFGVGLLIVIVNLLGAGIAAAWLMIQGPSG